MNQKQHEELMRAVEEAVKKTVNGKIDAFRTEVNAKLEAQNKSMEPVITAFSGGKGVLNAGIGLLKILALVGTAGVGWVVISNFVSKK